MRELKENEIKVSVSTDREHLEYEVIMNKNIIFEIPYCDVPSYGTKKNFLRNTEDYKLKELMSLSKELKEGEKIVISVDFEEIRNG